MFSRNSPEPQIFIVVKELIVVSGVVAATVYCMLSSLN